MSDDAAPSDHPLLSARGLSRRRPGGDGWLLRNVSLEIAAGTTLSLAGPSGSGKTLLLRALAMLDRLDEGQIHFRDEVPSRHAVPAFRREVLYLHQRPAILGATVEQALRRPFALENHRDRQFDPQDALRRIEQLDRPKSFLAQASANLSGGETQVVALVRALQLQPTLLLLDEPTAAMDPTTAAAAERLIRGWFDEAPERRAYLWVTHDAEQARRVADTTLWMEAGEIVSR